MCVVCVVDVRYICDYALYVWWMSDVCNSYVYVFGVWVKFVLYICVCVWCMCGICMSVVCVMVCVCVVAYLHCVVNVGV